MSRTDSPLRDRVIFIVGAMRSGTNWLQRMLAVHPDIASLPAETQLFSYGISRLDEIVHHGVATSPATTGLYMDPDEFHDAVRDFCDRAYGGLARIIAPGATYVLERSPQHALHLDLIGAVYPDAQVVHIIRDGRDVARSQVAQSYGPEDIREAAREWRHTIESARAAAQRVRTYVEIRYESLLAEPARNIGRLFDQLGLPADEAIISAAVEAGGVRFNVDPADPRLGHGKWRGSWSRADVAAFLAEVGPLADEFGLEAGSEAVARRRRRRKTLRRPPAVPDTARGINDLLAVNVRRVDEFISALTLRNATGIAEMVTADVDVRVVDHGDRRRRGAEGIDLLLDADAAMSNGWGRQVRGDVFPGTPSFTAVLRHQPEGEAPVDRVFVVRSGDELIDKVTYFRTIGQADP